MERELIPENPVEDSERKAHVGDAVNCYQPGQHLKIFI